MSEYQGLHTEPLTAATAEALAAELAARIGAAGGGGPRPAFVLFWGPPGAADQVGRVLESIKEGVPAVGVSTAHAFVDGRLAAAGEWGALCVWSAYLSARAGWGELPADGGKDGRTAEQVCVDAFTQSLAAEDYMRGGKPSRAERRGANGVNYRRPGFLLTFLPGMGGASPCAWPVSNKDYLLVELLASEVSRWVGIFGGSAAAAPKGDGAAGTWLAAVRPGGPEPERRVLGPGLVGLLVETDLAVGFACTHEFRKEDGPPLQVRADGAERPGGDIPRLGKLGRHHRVTLNGTPPAPLVVAAGADGIEPPFDPATGAWSTHVGFEEGEAVPCPPYRAEDGKYDFLRPLAAGTLLYPATVRAETAWADAVGRAYREAIENGEVRRPELVLVMSCKGRTSLFTPLDTGIAAGVAAVRAAVQADHPTAAVAGLGVDGETCPSRRGINLHWNWTVAVMVLGGDYNRRYADAARLHVLGEVDRDFAQRGYEQGLGNLVEHARVLMQADYVHVRIEGPAPKPADRRLQKAAGQGALYDAVVEALDPADGGEHAGYIAVRAYNDPAGRTIVERREDFVRRVTGHAWARWTSLPPADRAAQLARRGWAKPAQAVALLEGVEWWFAKVIRAGEQRIGVLVLASRDPRYYRPDAEAPFETVLTEFAHRAALALRAQRQQLAFTEVLNTVRKAETRLDLSRALVKAGEGLLGPGACLILFLPGRKGRWRPGAPAPARLVCEASANLPTGQKNQDVYVLLGPDVHAADKGLCGWLFEKGQTDPGRTELLVDDIKAPPPEVFGTPGGPEVKEYFKTTVAEYAFLLRDREGEPLGVLNAEAKAGVFSHVHRDMLRALANACSAALDNSFTEDRIWNHLKTLLPRHIHRHLKDKRGKQIADVGRPERRVVTLLCGDIRGYTHMSEIVGEERMQQFVKDYYALVAECVSRRRGAGVADRGRKGGPPGGPRGAERPHEPHEPGRKGGPLEGKRGTFDKFMGDGFLAFYGDYAHIRPSAAPAPTGPADLEAWAGRRADILDGVVRAVDTALEIADRFERELAKKWLPWWRHACPEVKAAHRFELGLAIHTGAPVVGLFGTDGGSGARLTYTGIGRDVNLVSRVCNEIEGNQVWVTATTREYLWGTDRFVIEPAPRPLEDLKGLPDLEIFQVKRRQ